MPLNLLYNMVAVNLIEKNLIAFWGQCIGDNL